MEEEPLPSGSGFLCTSAVYMFGQKIFLFFALMSASQLFAQSPKTEAKLKVSTEVDPEIRVTRTDGGADLDIIGGSVATFTVESNTYDGVCVTLESENGFRAKLNLSDPTSDAVFLPYATSIKVNNGVFEEVLEQQGNVRVKEIPQAEFHERHCDFSLKCKVKSLDGAVQGVYSDKITVKVTAEI